MQQPQQQQQRQLLQLRDHQGNTALHLAAVEGLPESVQLLLQAGTPINLPGQLSNSNNNDNSSSDNHNHNNENMCQPGLGQLLSHTCAQRRQML